MGPVARRRPTMNDVAARCGVSIKTVSRVVNGDPGASEATVARVLAVIDELGFRRNELASDLRQSHATSTIGVVIEDVSNPFYGPLIRAAEERAVAEGAMVLAVSSDEDPDRERELIAALAARRVAGLLVFTATEDHRFLLPELHRGLPVVFADRPALDLDCDTVLLDNVTGARDAVDHLLAQGHRRIGVVGDYGHVHTVRARTQGYREALRAAGVEVDDSLIRLGRHQTSQTTAAGHELLSLAEPPTAVFATNNRATIGVLRAARDRRAQVAVVGFDDFETADMLTPPATVVTYDPSELGRVAVDRLFARLHGDTGPARTIVVPTRLLVRGSGEMWPPVHLGGAARR